MRKLTWRPSARQKYLAILAYIAERKPAAAEKLDAQIEAQVDLLRNFPEIGRIGRIARTRELIAHPNYILIYRVSPTVVTILRVLHAHQKYP
jgi:toxin ParE1/3/4